MGFFGNIVGAMVDVALTPVALAKDVVDVATGNTAENTSNQVESSIKKVEKAFDDLF